MMKKLTPIAAVGFDVDRTIFHSPIEWSMQVGSSVTNWAAEQLGRDRDEFAAEFVERREQYGSNTLTLRSYGLDGELIFQEIFDKYPIDDFVKKDMQLITMINKLKKRYRLFIITNGTERQVTKKLKLLGLHPEDFYPLICAFDHGWAKPEPAPFLAALDSLKLSAEQCVYIGDREDTDIEGARAVGMRTIYIRGNSDVADVWCDTVYDIEKLL